MSASLYPNLESKPGSSYVLYLNCEGLNTNDLDTYESKLLLELINLDNVDQYAVYLNQDGLKWGNLYQETAQVIKDLSPNHPIRRTYNKKLTALYVPSLRNPYKGGPRGSLPNVWTNEDFTNLWRFVSYKLESFDVNVTTSRTVWANCPNYQNRYMSVITVGIDWNTAYKSFGINSQLNCPDNGISYLRLLNGRLKHVTKGISIGDLSDPTRRCLIHPINFIFQSYFGYPPGQNSWSSWIGAGRETRDIHKPYTMSTKSTVTNQYTEERMEGASALTCRTAVDLRWAPVDTMAATIAHEFGHIYRSLDHDGEVNGEGLEVVGNGGERGWEYYRGHGNWGPIMGSSDDIQISRPAEGVKYKTQSLTSYSSQLSPFYMLQDSPVIQWSKGEYKGATSKQDDIDVLGDSKGWVKEPPNSKNPTKLFV